MGGLPLNNCINVPMIFQFETSVTVNKHMHTMSIATNTLGTISTTK